MQCAQLCAEVGLSTVFAAADFAVYTAAGCAEVPVAVFIVLAGAVVGFVAIVVYPVFFCVWCCTFCRWQVVGWIIIFWFLCEVDCLGYCVFSNCCI